MRTPRHFLAVHPFIVSGLSLGTLAFALTVNTATVHADAAPATLPVMPTAQAAVATTPNSALTESSETKKENKAKAQALVTEGIGLLQNFDYQPALDHFLAAYDLYRSPKILLNIGSTLRDMGHLADAANTYQLYIEDPETNADRIAEVKKLLNELDQQLVVLILEPSPSGTDVSVDGGPWVPVGRKIMTRLLPGIHMVRGRKKDFSITELSLNTFVGETKNVNLALKVEDQVTSPTIATNPTTPTAVTPVAPPHAVATIANPNASVDTSKGPEVVTGWLITGAQAERGTVEADRRVAAVTSESDPLEDRNPVLKYNPYPLAHTIGFQAQARIDGQGRGAATALGANYEISPHWQIEGDVLLGKKTGIYLGVRMRFLTGYVRPYIAAGEPFFENGSPVVGVRAAGGLELIINGYLAIVGELGYEHFFNPNPNGVVVFESNVFVPLLGIELRL